MKNKFKKVAFIILAAPLFVSAQRESPSPPPPPSSFANKMFIGGNFGLQFGDFTLLELSPMVGYKVTDRFVPGITATYIYERIKDPSNYYPIYTTSIYGGGVFTRYYITPSFFAHVEYDVLNLDAPNEVGNYTTYSRANVAILFIGGGYRQPIGERSSFNILLLYDIIQNPNSPYSNPVIEVGFGLGF